MQRHDAIAVQQEVRLQFLEQQIQDGMQAFYKAGLALREIRDSRLYKEHFSSFEDYCQDRWQMGRQNAHYLVQAAGVCEMLVKHGLQVLPSAVRQAKPLASLSEDEAVEVWQTAVERSDGNAPTGKVVLQVISEREPLERADDVQEVAADSELTIPGAMSQPPKPKLPDNADVLGMELAVLREREGLLEGAIAKVVGTWDHWGNSLFQDSLTMQQLGEQIEELRELVA